MSDRIRLDQTRLNAKAWPRAELDQDRVAEFMELYEAAGLTVLPPITVIARADDYLIADGWHRAQALVNLGLEEVLIEVVPSTGRDPVIVAYEIGLRSSATASKPLTRAERQAAVLRLTVEGGRTDQEIADLVGVARTTVPRIRDRDSAMHNERDDDPVVRRSTPPDEAAVRLLQALDKVYEARGSGLSDALFGDRTGSRLAAALRAAYGGDAVERAGRYRDWIGRAIDELTGS
jgi:ParB-like chromosome segregation protein Spo0J